VPAGDVGAGLSSRQRERIEHATARAERASGITYAVWVGSVDHELRGHARVLLATTGSADGRAVVVAVDPGQREVEIVTSPEARRVLDDRSCALAAATMAMAFAGGDLVGGIEQGLASLADHAQNFEVLHLDQP
jgi:hypothetical protein